MHIQRLLFASTNQHKLEEVRQIIPPEFNVIGLRDMDWKTEIPEPHETFEQNAIVKAGIVFAKTGLACFAEDSGLIIDALAGKPGVYSARYAGNKSDSEMNIEKVMTEMQNMTERAAKFVSVIVLITPPDRGFVCRGEVKGKIATVQTGGGGFGYDPIFIPQGYEETFSALAEDVKNKISHRANAMKIFLSYLDTVS